MSASSSSSSAVSVVLSGSSSFAGFLAALGFGRSSSGSAVWALPLSAPGAVSAVLAARAAARARGLVCVVSRPSLASRPGSGWSVFFLPAGPAPLPVAAGFPGAPPVGFALPSRPLAAALRGLGGVSILGSVWAFPGGRSGSVLLLRAARRACDLFGFPCSFGQALSFGGARVLFLRAPVGQ